MRIRCVLAGQKQLPYVLLEEEGPVGTANRAQRGFENLMEQLDGFDGRSGKPPRNRHSDRHSEDQQAPMIRVGQGCLKLEI